MIDILNGKRKELIYLKELCIKLGIDFKKVEEDFNKNEFKGTKTEGDIVAFVDEVKDYFVSHFQTNKNVKEYFGGKKD
jgi:hypothetical protein